MKHWITAIAAALLLVTGCVSSHSTSKARPDAPDDVVRRIPEILATMDFSKPVPADEFLRTLGLFDWSNSVECTPGARHMCTAWRLNSTTVLEGHFNDSSRGYIGASMIRNGTVVARNVSPDWVLARTSQENEGAPNQQIHGTAYRLP